MKKFYKVKIISGVGEPQTLDISASTGNGSTTLTALPGGRYQLIDTATGLAPDNIRATRRGKDLKIHFDGRDQADLVIADFYAFSAADANTLVGEPKTGTYHAYIPESGEVARSIAQLSDGVAPTGMALGSESIALADFLPAALPIAAAGINPLWAAPFLLLGAGGGGGSKTAADTTPPATPTAAPASYVDNVGSITSAASTARFTDDTTPGVFVGKNLTDAPSLYVDGGKVDATYDAATGTLTPTKPLADGPHALTYTLTDAAGNESGKSPALNLTVDASNVSTSQGVGIRIDAIEQDTGVSQTDYVTGDNTVVWRGTLVENNTAKFNTEDWLQLKWVNAQSQTVDTEYIKPTLTAGVWKWSWPGHAQALADGVYTLNAQLVDTAGNVLSATPWASTQSVTIDTQAQQLNGARDTNAGLSINNIKMTALTDTGLSQTDFVTNNRQPIFTGKVTGESAFNVDTGRVLAEVIDSTGKVVAFQYLTPSATGDWTFDNNANSLGVDKAVTTYTLKTAIVDMAGHYMNATSQAFTVDLKTPVVSLISTSNQPENLQLQYTELGFSTNEQGVYFFNGDLQTGSKLNLGRVTPFAAQEFNLVFRDTAGNEQKITNDKTWDLSPISGSITLAKGSAGPSGFGDGQLLGSVGPNNGKYEMTSGENLDLSTLYSLTPTQGSNGANGGINHIVMGAGAQTLTVSIGDVLQLGLSNSFLKDDRLQMRIDGDGADKLNLTKQWANSTDQGWSSPAPLTLGAAGTYNVYTNDALKLDLLVKSEVQVTVI